MKVAKNIVRAAKTVACFMVFAFTVGAHADVIVTKDGKTLNVYNIDRGEKYITYTLEDSDNATLHRIAVGECFAVKIGDNPLQNVDVQATTTEPKSSRASEDDDNGNGPRYVEAVPDADNAMMIADINSRNIYNTKKKPQPGKLTNNFLALVGITDDSVLSDENVTVTFEPVDYYDCTSVNYKVIVRNKTNKPIYIDLNSCFRVKFDGTSESWKNNLNVTRSQGSESGASMNLGAVAGALGVGGVLGTLAGGANVGGGSNSGTSVTEYEDVILIIPPKASIVMPQRVIANEEGDRIVKNYEEIWPSWSRERDNHGVAIWDFTEATDNEKDYATSRIISYSTRPDFSEYTLLRVTFFIIGYYGVDNLNKYNKLQGFYNEQAIFFRGTFNNKFNWSWTSVFPAQLSPYK